MKKLIPEDAVLVPDTAQEKFRGTIFTVYQWPQTLFDGSSNTFEMLKRTDTVNAFCIVDDNLLVLHDEQPHLGARQSLPGGRVDRADPSTLAAAKREIAEETGYNFSNWRLVKVTQPYRKIEWFVYTYVAWQVDTEQELQLDPGEKISVERLGFEDFKRLVVADEGYLGELRPLLHGVEDLPGLQALPSYRGVEVDR